MLALAPGTGPTQKERGFFCVAAPRCLRAGRSGTGSRQKGQ